MRWNDFKELINAIGDDATLEDIEVISQSFDEHLAGKYGE